MPFQVNFIAHVRTNFPFYGIMRSLVLCLILASVAHAADIPVLRAHAFTLYGDPKYGPDFTHFDYVNPSAPKGGEIRLAAIGTYDNLNPFTLKGVAAAGSLMLYNRLCTKSKDEAFTEYGQLAAQMQMPEDRSWIVFELHPAARWHDGVPVTAADVIFSFEILTTKGIPFFRTFYADVDTVLRARRAPSKVRVQGRHQPRNAVDHRPVARIAQALLGGARICRHYA